MIDNTISKAALPDRLFTIQSSSDPEKANGSSLTPPQASKPMGIRLETIKLGSQKILSVVDFLGTASFYEPASQYYKK